MTRYAADDVTQAFLDLPAGERLLVLRRVVPEALEGLDRTQLAGFLRDLFGELAYGQRHGWVDGERPERRPPHFHNQASDEKTRRFLGEVAHEAELASGDEAAGPVAAVLTALQERITEREAHQLLAQLPAGIQFLATAARGRSATGDSSIDLGTFLSRISQAASVESDEAADLARAVFRVLRRWVGDGEIEDVESQLPADMKPLLTQA